MGHFKLVVFFTYKQRLTIACLCGQSDDGAMSKQIHLSIASDHAGYELKAFLLPFLKELLLGPHSLKSITDLGGDSSTAPDDYPDFARALGHEVLLPSPSLSTDLQRRGILICGSGVGAVIAANKISGIRAGLCHDTYSAHQGVEHDNMNILVMGSRVIGVELAKELCRSFLSASFTGEDRHLRRLRKVQKMEEEFCNLISVEGVSK
jgi:ribose 5-phosphate isomerase B